MDSNQGKGGITPSALSLHSEREFWTNESIAVLLNEYEKVFVKSGRGHVKCKDWELIAGEVNRGSGGSRKRTPEQCKTKIEGLKKYYRKERLKAVASPSDPRPWIFFDKLDRIMLTTSSPTPTPTPSLPLATKSSLVDPLPLPLPSLINDRPEKKVPAMGPNLDFQQRLLERMGLDRIEYQAQTIDGFENIVDEPRKKLKVAMDSPPPPKQAENPSTSLRSLAGKKRDYSSSLGRDIKEGLGSFAAVIEKIEQRKVELAESIQKQRLEQDRRLAEMEAERARLIMGNHLELAKLIGNNNRLGSDQHHHAKNTFLRHKGLVGATGEEEEEDRMNGSLEGKNSFREEDASSSHNSEHNNDQQVGDWACCGGVDAMTSTPLSTTPIL